MRLTVNKRVITNDKVSNSIYWGQRNVWISNGDIWCEQSMNMLSLTNSVFLMERIYNDIDR
jgi:hypothetical protein